MIFPAATWATCSRGGVSCGGVGRDPAMHRRGSKAGKGVGTARVAVGDRCRESGLHGAAGPRWRTALGTESCCRSNTRHA